MEKELRFIGVVRSEVKERRQMPPFGAPAAVEIHPQYEPALLHTEKHSHFWVLAWLMARPERDVLQVTPRGVSPDAPGATHGVFAVRSPARPNPIGLSAAALLRRDHLTLHFDRLDFLDGTPVIDLKPYFASRDMIFSARNTTIGRPKDPQSLRDSLLSQALRFCGEPHPDVDTAVQMMEHFRIAVMNWREPERWDIAVPLNRPHLADALMGMTRVTLSRGLSLTAGPNVEINGTVYSPAIDF